MSLAVHLQGIVGKGLTLLPSNSRRGLLGVDSKHVATRGEHERIKHRIATRSRGYEAAVKAVDHRCELLRGAGGERVGVDRDIAERPLDLHNGRGLVDLLLRVSGRGHHRSVGS